MPDRTTERVLPSHADPVARAASTAVGGPWGRHGIVGRQWFWTPLRVILLMAVVLLALGWLQKSPCQNANWSLAQPVKNGSGQLQYVDGKQYVDLCYSDVIPLYGGEGLDRGAIPYLDHPVEYPVLTGFFMYAAAELGRGYDALARDVPALPQLPPVESYYQVTVLMLAICALVAAWAVVGLAGRRRVWDAALVALAPLLAVQGFTNWDLLAVALACTGMLAWARRRPALAGVLFGLGAAAKLYPLFLLGPLLVLCLRTRRMREFWVTLGGAVGAWLVVNLPVAIAAPKGWSTFFANNANRPADPDSLWNVAQQVLGTTFAVKPLNIASIVLFALVCVGVAVLGLAAPRRPRVAQLGLLIVAGFLLTNKVWSPQYSLWLVPLAVLARPKWRLFLVWQFIDAFLWFPRMYWFLQTTEQTQANSGLHVLVRGLDLRWFLLVVVARDIVVAIYCGLVVRDILRPDRDPVRSDGLLDDPAGGILDRAPDAGWSLAPAVQPFRAVPRL